MQELFTREIGRRIVQFSLEKMNQKFCSVGMVDGGRSIDTSSPLMGDYTFLDRYCFEASHAIGANCSNRDSNFVRNVSAYVIEFSLGATIVSELSERARN